ncbi:MAG: bifunctional phosphopantothenoylcysteine decarboxylase/phosphopantothenate--cysteine ligase CoaBC, partial [Bacteroidota bacterium]
VGHGELASGLVGDGRMAEPEEIVQQLDNFFAQKTDLIEKKILLTAGPTYEAIDPVRFIGNRSSGKMGVAIAKELANRGARVELVLGPSNLKVEHPNIKIIKVESAAEMYEASLNAFPNCDGAILAAAVADYRPQNVQSQKIKKSGTTLELVLEKTEDIAATLGKQKQKNQFLIGFALETTNEIENAKSKLERKNFDFIVLNSLQDKGAGFGHDTNKITILHKNGEAQSFGLKSKQAVAKDIVNQVVQLG